MKVINGDTYSKTPFDEYKIRLRLEIVDKEHYVHGIDIYSTAINSKKAIADIKTIATENVLRINLKHKATRDEDDRLSELLNEWLDK